MNYLLLLNVLFSGYFAEPDTVKIHTSAVCETCKEALEKDLSFEKGVKSSDLDLVSKDITVVYDADRTNPEKIRLRISKVGYDADDVKKDPKAFKRLPDCCKKECTHH